MRILILRHIEKNSMDDIFHQTDYSSYEWIKATNVGNKLWLMGLISTISTPENQIDFLESYMDADYINANYDICIKPEANIFSPRFRDGMERHIARYKDVTIPIYVIACGAAAKSYDELDELCSAIREPASAFIRSVYKTGGEFCLRGYFTKEMFNRLGFHDAMVTGCPSLYQVGRNLQVPHHRVSPDCFKVVLNGTVNQVKTAMKRNSNSVFIDQGSFYPLLYDVEYKQDTKNAVKTYGTFGIRLLQENRIKLWVDLQDWADYLLTDNVSFSCGSRIHGNIMPILCGIPAAISPPDARVREMAEFFEIPMVTDADLKNRSLYEIYSETDFRSFNQNFTAKYDAYEDFLVQRGIVKKAENPIPMLNTDKAKANTQRLKDIQKQVQTEHIHALYQSISGNPFWHIYDAARNAAIRVLEKAQ